MKVYTIYFVEFLVKVIYSFFSYLLCWGLAFNNINTIFLFEVTPLLTILVSKRLIFTQLTQLFNTIWFCSSFLSAFFVFPLIAFHIKCFMKTAWYTYQIQFYNLITTVFIFCFVIIYLSNHFLVIPNIISFFLYWEIIDEYSLLRVESELSLFYYIVWSLVFKFCLTFFLIINLVCLIITFYFLTSNYLFKLVQNYKKLTFFNLICFLFILIPPDFMIQVFLIIVVYLLIEFFFVLICIKLQNKINILSLNKKYNAHFKTVIKNTKKEKKKNYKNSFKLMSPKKRDLYKSIHN